MGTEQILTLLIQERDKLNRVIEALEGSTESGTAEIVSDGAPKPKRVLSATVRRKMALGQKRRWAALKSAK